MIIASGDNQATVTAKESHSFYSESSLPLSDKRKKTKFAEKRRARRAEQPAAEGRVAQDREVPFGAVIADQSKQVPNNSYDAPPAYYIDIEFKCCDCGREEVWTAQQQKWYYEVAKGSLYATAVRCHECRKKRRERSQAGGDPNPIKTVGALMKRVRSKVEPAILATGFVFESRNKPAQPNLDSTWLDYSRRDMLLSLNFAPRTATLQLETIRDGNDCRCEVRTQFERAMTNDALMARIDAFCEDVSAFLATLT